MAIKNNFKQILIDKIQGRKIKMRITKSSQEKNKKKNYKKVLQKVKRQIQGITLIALVVTIIVLLILAGVTIATLTGDNRNFN